MVTQQDIKLEEERLLKKYIEFQKEYQNKICPKCIGTQQQKDRECEKLGGFKDLGCEHMTKAITRRLLPNNRILISMIINQGKEFASELK